MELFKAHAQWSNRPADETFESIEAMHEACSEYRADAVEHTVAFNEVRVEAHDGEVLLVGKKNIPAKLTHWSFGQIAQRAGAPPSYLRKLPATLAAQNMNHGLKARDGEDDKAALLFHKNGSLVLRAAVSEQYSRIWNADITERLLGLQQDNPNWKLPKAYKRTVAGSVGFQGISNEMVPRGAYASDHDMFAFLVDESKKIEVKGCPQGMNRGFFVWNSEVGASSFGIQTFLYDMVCGNHIVWGARQVTEMRVRHIGDASPQAFMKLGVELRRFSDSSVSDLQAKILSAQNMVLGATKDDVLDAILGKRITELTRGRLTDAYELAERAERYGSPRTVWGMVNGLTELSQKSSHADARVSLDRAAGKVLEFAF